jgi:dTDP-4-amino-4,6-dideoxygalactose transaminase
MSGIPDLILPYVPVWAEPVWHLFVVRTKNRLQLTQKLSEKGIGWLIHYPLPPHLQQAYTDLQLKAGGFPISEVIANEVVSLPIGPHMQGADILEVVNVIKKKKHQSWVV